MTGIRINHPAPRDLQARRIRVRHGMDETRAALVAGLCFGASRQ